MSIKPTFSSNLLGWCYGFTIIRSSIKSQSDQGPPCVVTLSTPVPPTPQFKNMHV